MNIAYIFGWAPVLGVIPRLVRTERKSYWGHLLGYSVAMAWFICIGAMTGLLMGHSYGIGSTDPTEWLIALAGPKLGILSFIFIGFANVTTQAVCTYSITVSTKIINPRWNYKVIATLWSVLCALLVVWKGIWDYYTVFLALVGAICVPVVTLLLVDFYLVRRGRFSLRSLYRLQGRDSYRYSKGVNVFALLAFLLGIGAYFLVYDPIAYWPRSGIFWFTTASGLNALVAGGSYWLLSRLPFVRVYLLRDREEGTVRNG
jgi:NCS1 family nucleobase:cation symporter-1